MGTLKASSVVLICLAALGGGAALLRDDGPERLAVLVGAALAPEAVAPVHGADDGSPEPAADPPAPTLPVAPVVDVVRLEPDGSGLVSGTGRPGAPIEILVDGDALWSGAMDARGTFVAFVDLPPSDVARALWLRSTDENGAWRRSEASVVLAPTPALAATAPPVASDPVPVRADLEAPPPLESGPEGVRPLAPPALDPAQGVAVDTVRYGAEGEVILSGRSETGQSDLAIYLDGALEGRVRTGARGDWEATLTDVPSGDYRLRADVIDGSGRVAGRVDLPFRRETPEIVEAARIAADAADQSAALITVQPGFSLWAIARDRYGDGFQYVAVYSANADQIADPDLIYPGQVLTLPAGPAPAGD